MVFRLSITSQDPKPPHRHFRTGTLISASINSEIIKVEKRLPQIGKILENFELVDYVEIEMKYYKHTHEPYPDFLTIDVILNAINLSAQDFLNEHKIEHSTKPINILNEKELQYKLIMFPTRDLIDVKASKGYINDGEIATEGKDYFDGEIVLKLEAKNIQGIFRLDKLANVLICDEETKNKLEKSRLIGFSFEELEISKD